MDGAASPTVSLNEQISSLVLSICRTLRVAGDTFPVLRTPRNSRRSFSSFSRRWETSGCLFCKAVLVSEMHFPWGFLLCPHSTVCLCNQTHLQGPSDFHGCISQGAAQLPVENRLREAAQRGSHLPHVATKHLQWGESELRCAVSVKYTLEFEDSMKKEYQISH